jgi:DNA-binding NarL/FixJ family response regulator
MTMQPDCWEKKRINPEVASQLADHSANDALTSREIEVLSLIAGGRANKIIADQLSISEETVKRHVKNILSKKRGIFEL